MQKVWKYILNILKKFKHTNVFSVTLPKNDFEKENTLIYLNLFYECVSGAPSKIRRY